MQSRSLRKAAWTAAGIAAFLILWEGTSRAVGSPLLLPGPAPTLVELLKLCLTARFAEAALASFARVAAGFALALPVSIAVGIAAGLNADARAFTKPFFAIVSATPVLSVILLALLWFGPDRVPVFTAFLMVFPVLAANVREGVGAVDSGLVECAEAYRLSRLQRLRHLYLPALLPFIAAGARSGLSLSWKVVVAAEVLAQPARALGTGMQNAKANLETTELLAWTVAAVALAGICDIAASLLMKRRRSRGRAL